MGQKKWIGLGFSALLIAIVTFLVVKNSGPTEETYRIGADLTLTGDTAFWSEQLKKGLDLAVEEDNDARLAGSPRIKVIYEDNQGNVAKAVGIWQKLDTVDQVSAVISCFTPMSNPLRENAGASKLSLLAAVTVAKDFGLANQWSFRDYMPQEQQVPPIAKYAYDTLKLRKAAYLVVNDDFGLDGYKAFKEAFERLGGQVVVGETFEQKDTDIRSQARKILDGKPDCVYIVGRNQSHALAIKQLRELGFTGRMLGGNGFDAEPTMKMVGSAGDGFVFASSYFDLDADESGRALKAKYQKKYNELPEHVSVYGYTMGQYLCKALRDGKGDRDTVRQSLSTMEMGSVRGPLKMNPQRDVMSPIGIYEFRDGKRNLLIKLD